MKSTLLGMVTLVSWLLTNTLSSIDVMLEGMLTLVSWFLKNAPCPIVEYLVNGIDIKKNNNLFDNNIRSIIQIFIQLEEKDKEIILGLSKILKEQSEKE
jgi:hypothetical protein